MLFLIFGSQVFLPRISFHLSSLAPLIWLVLTTIWDQLSYHFLWEATEPIVDKGASLNTLLLPSIKHHKYNAIFRSSKIAASPIWLKYLRAKFLTHFAHYCIPWLESIQILRRNLAEYPCPNFYFLLYKIVSLANESIFLNFIFLNIVEMGMIIPMGPWISMSSPLTSCFFVDRFHLG